MAWVLQTVSEILKMLCDGCACILLAWHLLLVCDVATTRGYSFMSRELRGINILQQSERVH